MTTAAPRRLEVDGSYVQRVLVDLLRTPSPTGRTDAAVQYVAERLLELGLDLRVTRRGVLDATLPGRRPGADRAVAVHVDAIGCMVERVKEDGRLQVAPLGSHTARSALGAHVVVYTDDPSEDVPGRSFPGTVVPVAGGGSAGLDWPDVEVRVDEPVHTEHDTAALGIQVGDVVAVEANPVLTAGGHVKSRHLDGKAGVAAALGAIKALRDSGTTPPVGAHLLVTLAGEIGHGATHGLDDDVAELVAVENALVGPGQQSREDAATVVMLDAAGPFDHHLTRRLLALARQHRVPHTRDTLRWRRSDAAGALDAGLDLRTALVGVGVDSRPGSERTHLDGVRAVAGLLALYLQSDLVLPDPDEHSGGTVAYLPGRSAQPTQLEERRARRASDRRGNGRTDDGRTRDGDDGA